MVRWLRGRPAFKHTDLPPCRPCHPALVQLLKPFKPAEDRFAGWEVARSEVSGAAIVPDSAAYLECQVTSRMEAGDHVVLYATVASGKVLDDRAQPVMMFRKTADHY